MEAPFFSIVIPTRNRYETLYHTIKTVLEQDFDSFELIVSDNSDLGYPGAEDLMNKIPAGQNINYIRPPLVLSMSDHWEFAVSKCVGEFIIIFGDDDGLVTGALTKIHDIIGQTHAKLVSWARVEYSWPDRLPVELANEIVIPYKANNGIMEAKDYIKKVVRYVGDYRYLPMFYNAAVNRSLVQLLKDRTGRVFSARSPDIYTGYAFAWLLQNYISVGYPLSINGVSSKSNGAAHYTNDNMGKADFVKLNQTSSIKWPALLPEMYTGYLGIIEPFIQLSVYFPELKSYISRKGIYKILLKNLEATSKEDFDDKIKIILDSAKQDKKFHQWVSSYMEKEVCKYIPEKLSGLSKRIGFRGSHLTLDASRLGLNNVYDVSVFVGNLFGDLKECNYNEKAKPGLIKRIKKAAAFVLRGV